MPNSNSIDYAIAVPTFIGSSLSFLATSTAIALQIARPPQRHFRHALIINLLISDMMNSLCNAISGSIFLALGTPSNAHPPTSSCIANAWINQLSVQTIDFNILIISVTVLLSVVRPSWISSLSTQSQALMCLIAWIPGLITSNIALGLHAYAYVSGNWCWIRSDRLVLRYSLTHGWRIAIFFATIAIYTYVYFRLRRTLTMLRKPCEESQELVLREQTLPSSNTHGNRVTLHPASLRYPKNTNEHNTFVQSSSESESQAFPTSSPESEQETMHRRVKPLVTSHMPRQPNLTKMLLMNGYPIAYIILWVPGIANRLVESVSESPRWLKALQACTQFIGLANALTYGISEQMRRQFWKKITDSTS